ncbi:MAG: NAD(P)-dependent oxidoreductase [Pseudomonadota bacterium]
MKRIAVLGLGAMGARMAVRLIDAGFDVTVFNRSAAQTEPLRKLGAGTAATPAAAARDADVVLSMVRDDAASAAVWDAANDGALSAMRPDAVAIECSTVSPRRVAALAANARARGIALIDAPLAGSRPQAEAGALIFFAGGEQSVVASLAPVFDALGQATHYMGETGTGAATKLVANALFGIQLAAIAELFGLADAQRLDAEQLLDVLAATPLVSPAAAVAGRAMLARQFAPAFPIELVAKDFDLVAATAADVGIPLSKATREVYRDAIAAGFGDANITGIVQRYR